MQRHMLLACVFSFVLAIPAFAADLNPQPLPPGAKSKGSHTNTPAAVNPAVIHGFNPQPDPPGKNKSQSQVNNPATNAAVTHGFNPQPDPPGDNQVQNQAAQH